jgi:hypothetical protein
MTSVKGKGIGFRVRGSGKICLKKGWESNSLKKNYEGRARRLCRARERASRETRGKEMKATLGFTYPVHPEASPCLNPEP